LRQELSDAEQMDLQDVVDIIIAGDPSLEDLFPPVVLQNQEESERAAFNHNAEASQLKHKKGSQQATPEQVCLTTADDEDGVRRPSLETLRRLRLQKFCPHENEEPQFMELSEPTEMIVPPDFLYPATTTATTSPSSPFSTSLFTSPVVPPPLSGPTWVSPPEATSSPGLTGSPVAPTSSSLGAGSLMRKSSLSDTAYVPLSEIHSTKLSYLLERLAQVRSESFLTRAA